MMFNLFDLLTLCPPFDFETQEDISNSFGLNQQVTLFRVTANQCPLTTYSPLSSTNKTIGVLLSSIQPEKLSSSYGTVLVPDSKMPILLPLPPLSGKDTDGKNWDNLGNFIDHGNNQYKPKIKNVIFTSSDGSYILQILNTPEFNNHEKIEWFVKKTKLRGNIKNVFRDKIWPKYVELDYTFITDCNHKFEILTFLRNTIGQSITLTDYIGRVWQGIITNPETKIEQISRAFISVNIVFEGDLISW